MINETKIIKIEIKYLYMINKINTNKQYKSIVNGVFS